MAYLPVSRGCIRQGTIITASPIFVPPFRNIKVKHNEQVDVMDTYPSADHVFLGP